MRIIGIDPGSRITGYGILDSDGYRHKYVTSGFIDVKADTFAVKLGIIFKELSSIIEQWEPHEMAVEQVFVSRNADSALKLGQARGAVICAGVHENLSVAEYSARAIKKAVVGFGSADKKQVQLMIKTLLSLDKLPQSDEADALATAVCHSHHINIQSTGVATGSRGGRWV